MTPRQVKREAREMEDRERAKEAEARERVMQARVMQEAYNAKQIWHVQVFFPDKVEDYYFWHRADVLNSIHTTYGKVKDTIQITESGMHISVRGTDLLEEVHIEAQPITLGMLVLDKPTHF